MKCEIIRDLLPSYIDGLTSEESNIEIEKHLETCPDCRKVLEKMRKEIGVTDISENKKSIKPFKKLKRLSWRAAGITALCLILLFGGYLYYFGHGSIAEQEDVSMTYEKVYDVVTLGFMPKDDSKYINVEVESVNPYVITVKEYNVNPLDKPITKGGYFGFTFIDDNTIMNEDGSAKTIDENDTLTIKYEDTTQVIKIVDLADEESFNNK